jgi:hypothetical protein
VSSNPRGGRRRIWEASVKVRRYRCIAIDSKATLVECWDDVYACDVCGGMLCVMNIYIYIYRYEYMRIDRRKRLQVLSVSDARSGMLNACKQHCILCTVSYLCRARLRKRGKLILEMRESKSLSES